MLDQKYESISECLCVIVCEGSSCCLCVLVCRCLLHSCRWLPVFPMVIFYIDYHTGGTLAMIKLWIVEVNEKNDTPYFADFTEYLRRFDGVGSAIHDAQFKTEFCSPMYFTLTLMQHRYWLLKWILKYTGLYKVYKRRLSLLNWS